MRAACRRTEIDARAAAITRNDAASASSAAFVPAAAASAPPTSGPTAKPRLRADSTSPFARPSDRGPARAGTSANSAD